VKNVFKKCLKLAHTLILEKEYFLFLKPDKTISASNLRSNTHKYDRNSSKIGQDCDMKFSIIGDLNESMRITTTTDIENPTSKRSPFLIEKHMQRDSIAFEFFSLSNNRVEKDSKTNNIL
jgi:hypothetical protein